MQQGSVKFVDLKAWNQIPSYFLHQYTNTHNTELAYVVNWEPEGGSCC